MTGTFARLLCLLLGTTLVAGLLATGPTADAVPLRPSPSPKPRPGETAALTCPNTNPDQDYLCPIGPTYNVPALNDLNGWADAEKNHSIHYGDLDGDGSDEMVARSAFGAAVYRFNAELGQWSQLRLTNAIMSDSMQWDDPSGVIHLGDVDGDGKAELVARSKAGILVGRLVEDAKTNTGTWTWLTGAGPLSDAEGFNQPRFYQSIQLVALGTTGGSTRVNLMARGTDGLGLYRFEKGAWELSAVNASFADAQGWDKQPYSATITGWDATTVVARAENGLFTVAFDPGTATGANWGSWAAPRPSAAASGVWTDAQGWSQEQYYTTITPVRGHGSQVTLAARVPGGIGSVTQQADGSFTVNPTVAGADGTWSQPMHYATIQAGDVDGDGADELLARGPDGMLTYTFDSGTGALGGPLSAGVPALSDATWSNVTRYGTIATAQLEKGKGRALLARGGHGVRTWRFDTTAKAFTRYRPYGNFPLTDQASQAAMTEMQHQLGLSITVRETFTSPTIDNPAVALRGYLEAIAGLCPAGNRDGVNPYHYSSCPAPSGTGISTDTWTKVSNQLLMELYWAANVVDHFEATNTMQKSLFLDEDELFPTIVDDLKLAQAKAAAAAPPPPTEGPDLVELFEGITELLAVGVGLIPELEPVAIALEATSAALSITATAAPKTDPDKTPDDPFADNYQDLQDQITAHHEEMEDKLAAHRHWVLADYGLLGTIGGLVGSQTWTLDQLASASSGRQSFARLVYRRFLPILWDHWSVTQCASNEEPDGTDRYCVMPQKTNWTIEQLTAPQCEPHVDCWGGSFSGYLPRQNPCVPRHPDDYWWDCTFVGPEQSGYSDLVDLLRSPLADNCTYNGSGDDSAWRYGCSLGLAIGDLASWGFAQRACTWDAGEHQGGQCNGVAPAGLVSATANLRGQGAGSITMTLRDAVPKGFDLRGARVHLDRLLQQSAVGTELLQHSSGGAALPATTTVARGSTSTRAAFTITVKPPKPKGTKPKANRPRGKAARIQGDLRVKGGKLTLRLTTDGTALNLPESCGSDGLVRLGTHVVVTDRKGRFVQYLMESPWQCVDPPGPRPLSKLTYPAGG